MDPKPRVLMIDDSELAVDVQTMLFERNGFAVRSCLELAGVAAALAEFQPEVVLLDAQLGDATVEEAVAAIRAEPGGCVPLLLCSGMEEHALEALAGRLGLDGYIGKSEPQAVVVRKVRDACAR